MHMSHGGYSREAICLAVSSFSRYSSTMGASVVSLAYSFVPFIHFAFSNVISAGSLGYIGVSRGMIGVPFVNPYYLYSFRNPAILGGAIYGAMGGALAALGGKRL